MFAHSIRWRLQIWLGFLLVCVLSGFGAAVYQLHRINQFHQIDEELERRVSAIRAALRPPFGPHFGPPPFDKKTGPLEDKPGRPDQGPRSFDQKPERRELGPPPLFEDRPGRFNFDHDRKRPPPGSPGGEGEGRFAGWEIRIPPDVLNLFGGTDTNEFYFAIWSPLGKLVKSSTNAPPDLPMPNAQEGNSQSHLRVRGYFREIFYFGAMGDCVLAGRFIKTDLESIGLFAWWLLAAGGLVLAFGLGGAWWLTTHAIRPVEEISAAANRISAGNLSERIKVADPENELGQLAGVLNSAFARLDSAFAQQKQFTADAAHELRTPLAVLISEAQATLARERSAPEYRETVFACLETAQQMRRLTESLLELARFDAGQERIRHGPLEVNEIVQACVERVRTLAKDRAIQIYCDLGTVSITGDADRLSQVFTNLLTNAIYYNKPSGEVRVRTFTENGLAVITVEDHGQGISAEDIPHLFKRFYRADKARSAAAGRNGLGLAICRAIVEAHGGAIEVRSQLGSGTTFTVRLPA